MELCRLVTAKGTPTRGQVKAEIQPVLCSPCLPPVSLQGGICPEMGIKNPQEGAV